MTYAVGIPHIELMRDWCFYLCKELEISIQQNAQQTIHLNKGNKMKRSTRIYLSTYRKIVHFVREWQDGDQRKHNPRWSENDLNYKSMPCWHKNPTRKKENIPEKWYNHFWPNKITGMDIVEMIRSYFFPNIPNTPLSALKAFSLRNGSSYLLINGLKPGAALKVAKSGSSRTVCNYIIFTQYCV